MTCFDAPRLRWPVALCSALCLFATGADAETIRVAAGESITRAIERAEPHAVIEVEPGTYHEALVIDLPGITLRGIVRGAERPILDGRGEMNDGVIVSGSPFAMSGFRVQHYKGNGVTTQGVDGVVLTDLEIDDTGLYGVYPVQSRNVTVTHCEVTRIVDAGIYVRESQTAVVAFNEVHNNVAGIEIENTNDADVYQNLAYENTAGIVAFVLPNKVQKVGLRTRIHDNWSLRNNTPNFGDPKAIVGQLPHGIGIMVMGADDTVLENNVVKGNQSAGIVVVRLDEEHALKDPELEPMTDGLRVGFNQLAGNGVDPHPYFVQAVGGGGDFVWDGTGQRNCADLPDQATRAGAPIPSCLGRPSPDTVAPMAAAVTVLQATESSDRDEMDVPSGHVVFIRGMRYEPRHLKVKKGATVTWVNMDGVTHTVTSGVGTTPTSSPLASPFLLRGDSYSHTFAEPGDYEYLCLPHLDQAPMRGASVKVSE